jgi:hypothetical protein
MNGRLVVEAKLGCPDCGAEYFIRNGVAIFSGEESTDSVLQISPPDDAAVRIAAFLDLTGSGKIVLLAGDEATSAEALSELADARIIALNSPLGFQSPLSERIAQVRARVPIPLALRSLDGVALDDAHSIPEIVSEAARLLRPRGRLLASARAALSPEFRELARDETHVIAEYVGELVSLRR